MARPHPHKRAARLAAISILSVLAAVVGVWAAPRVSDAVAAWMSAPPVHAWRSAGACPAALPPSVRPRRAGRARRGGPRRGAGRAAAARRHARRRHALHHGRRHLRAAGAPGAVIVLLRTSEDGQTWSRWYTVALERVAEEGGGRSRPSPSRSGRAPGAICRCARCRRAGGRRRPRACATCKRRGHQQHGGRRPRVRGRRRRPPRRRDRRRLRPRRRRRAAMTTKPHDRDPAQWGANESWRSGSPDYAPVKMAFVHHTDSGNDYTRAEAPAIVRGIYAYHTKSLHWSDVGYNFLIDRYGTIYEGRYGGVTRGVDRRPGARLQHGEHRHLRHRAPSPARRRRPRPSRRWSGCSSGSSTCTTWTRRAPARSSAATGRSTPPDSTSRSRPSPVIATPTTPTARASGCTRSCPTCARSWRAPASPRSTASSWRTRRSAPTATGCATARPSASPSRRPPTWRLDDPRRARRDCVRHIERRGQGRGDHVGRPGRRRPACSRTACTRCAPTPRAPPVRRVPPSPTVRLDTVAPDIKSATVTPDPFSPNGDGQDDVAGLRFKPARAGTARVSVVDGDGDVVRRLTGWTAACGGRADSVTLGRPDLAPRLAAPAAPRARPRCCSSSATRRATSPTRRRRSRSTGRSACLGLAARPSRPTATASTTPSRSRSGSRGPPT